MVFNKVKIIWCIEWCCDVETSLICSASFNKTLSIIFRSNSNFSECSAFSIALRLAVKLTRKLTLSIIISWRFNLEKLCRKIHPKLLLIKKLNIKKRVNVISHRDQSILIAKLCHWEKSDGKITGKKHFMKRVENVRSWDETMERASDRNLLTAPSDFVFFLRIWEIKISTL